MLDGIALRLHRQQFRPFRILQANPSPLQGRGRTMVHRDFGLVEHVRLFVYHEHMLIKIYRQVFGTAQSTASSGSLSDDGVDELEEIEQQRRNRRDAQSSPPASA